MFGVNILNVFSVGRYVESTTILWLRYVSVLLILIGIGIVYYDSMSPSPSIIMKIVGWIVVVLGLLSILWYLLYGYYYTSTSNTCIYCPKTPIRAIISNQSATTPTPMNLPQNDPFSHTALYYLVVDDIKPIPSENPNSIIQKTNLYDIVIDGTTGEFGVMPYGSNTSQRASYFGNLPKQTLTQVAIIHEEKEIRVFVNGMPRGALLRSNLPPTSSIQRGVVFNKDNIVRSGLVYQAELYSEILTPEDMFRRYEAMSIAYENDVNYQNTKYPTENSRSQMGISDTFLGYIRLLSSLFGYSRGVDIASVDIKYS